MTKVTMPIDRERDDLVLPRSNPCIKGILDSLFGMSAGLLEEEEGFCVFELGWTVHEGILIRKEFLEPRMLLISVGTLN